MALEQAFLAIEARLYVGRVAERRILLESLRLSAQSPVAVYVHGPREIGKSALLRAFLRDSGRSTVVLRGDEAAEGAQAILGLLADRLTLALGTPTRPNLSAVRGALLQASRHGGLVLAVDGYDELGAAERWLREEILYHTGAGVLVVLCGRTPPAQIWPGERVWRAFVRPLPLPELPQEEAEELLSRQGVQQARLRLAAWEVVGGWPRSLLEAADALQISPFCAPSDVPGRILEQILHPGSRRLQWRAAGTPGDELVAAAALMPAIRRDALRGLVGGSRLEQGWEQLMRIAFPGADGYAIPDQLRSAITAHVLRIRPWQAQQWRKAALAAATARLRQRRGVVFGASEWHEIAALARRAPWHAALHPPLEEGADWQVQRGSLDVSEIEALPGASEADITLCAEVLERAPDCVLTLRGVSGELLAWLLLATNPARVGDLLAQHPRWQGLPPAPIFGHHGTHALVVAALAESKDAKGACAVLLRETVPDWQQARRVYAATGSVTGADGEDVLTLMGFHPLPPLGVIVAFDVPEKSAHLLDRLLSSPSVPAPPERERVSATKEALGRMFDGDLSGTRLAEYLQASEGEHADPAAYLRDALCSADLGGPGGMGQDILRMYYVERYGAHEAVAERLDLPRATYFRLHKHSLARLASALFA